MSAVFEQLNPFRQAGIAIVCAHHHGKRSSSEGLRHAIRGSSDILAAVQSHLAVELGANKRLRITQTKSRQSQEVEPFEIEVVCDESGMVNFEFVGGAILASKLQRAKEAILKVVAAASPGPSQQELIKRVVAEDSAIGARTVRTAVNELVAGGGLVQQRGAANSYIYSLPTSEGGSVAKTSSL
jgi:hypothetical protein